jgi:hypothetical protein
MATAAATMTTPAAATTARTAIAAETMMTTMIAAAATRGKVCGYSVVPNACLMIVRSTNYIFLRSATTSSIL